MPSQLSKINQVRRKRKITIYKKLVALWFEKKKKSVTGSKLNTTKLEQSRAEVFCVCVLAR